MKYNELVKKLVAKGTSLKKAKKEPEPLHLKLTKQGWHELQEDIILNHPDMHPYYRPSATETEGVYLVKHTDTGVQGIITIQ